MEVHVFKGSGGAYGFTTQAEGDNLPAEHGPWEFFKTLNMDDAEVGRIGVNTRDALADINTKGYHIATKGKTA